MQIKSPSLSLIAQEGKEVKKVTPGSEERGPLTLITLSHSDTLTLSHSHTLTHPNTQEVKAEKKVTPAYRSVLEGVEVYRPPPPRERERERERERDRLTDRQIDRQTATVTETVCVCVRERE